MWVSQPGISTLASEWVCSGLRILIDDPPDINAAINIKYVALQDQNLVGVAGVRTHRRACELRSPMGRRMIAGKPPPEERRGSSHQMSYLRSYGLRYGKHEAGDVSFLRSYYGLHVMAHSTQRV